MRPPTNRRSALLEAALLPHSVRRVTHKGVVKGDGRETGEDEGVGAPRTTTAAPNVGADYPLGAYSIPRAGPREADREGVAVEMMAGGTPVVALRSYHTPPTSP